MITIQCIQILSAASRWKNLQQMGQASLVENLVTQANLETRQLDKFTAAIALRKAAWVTLGKPADVVLERLSIQQPSWSH